MKQIKKLMTLGVATTAMILMTGCGGSMYSVASNGKYYQMNQSNCPNSRLKGEYLRCYDKKGKYITSLAPVHPNVVNDYRYKKQQKDNSIRSMNQSIQMANQTAAINNVARSNYSYTSSYTPYNPTPQMNNYQVNQMYNPSYGRGY